MQWETDYIAKTRGEASIPWTIDNLGNNHLTQMLRVKGIIKKSVSVRKIDKEILQRADGGTGKAGRYTELYRLHASYEGGEGPSSMIIKLCPLSPEFHEKRVQRKKMRSWEIEAKTYNRGAPFTNLRIAKGYFSVFDKDASRYLILMEDLNLRSPYMATGNLAKGLLDCVKDSEGKIIKSEIGTSLAAFEGAARFHAQHWNKTHEHNCKEYARSFAGPYYKQMLPNLYPEAWK